MGREGEDLGGVREGKYQNILYEKKYVRKSVLNLH